MDRSIVAQPSLPPPPLLRGWPVIGNLWSLMRGTDALFMQGFRRLGPLFQVAVMGKSFTVMAGPQANLFLAKEGDRFLHNRPLFLPLVNQFGGNEVIVAQDGEAHRQGRRTLKPIFSRDAIAGYVPTMVETTARMATDWQAGQRLDLVAAMRRLIATQTGLAMIGHAPGEDFEALSTFFTTAVAATITRRSPARTLQSPAYLAAKAQSLALMRRLFAERQAAAPDEGKNLLDLLLAAEQADGSPMAEGDRLATSLLPFFGGLDTVAHSCAFFLYALLSQPALLRQVQEEVDAAFAEGLPTPATFRAMPALHGAAMETLRLYPVASAVQRQVVEPFDFAGCHVAAGQRLIVATPLPHPLPELFPEPTRFDVARYQPPRNEHRQAGAFAPFALGAHTCLGAGLAEVQMMVTVATLLHHTRLALPPGYRLRLKSDPITRPVGLTVRVLGA